MVVVYKIFGPMAPTLVHFPLSEDGTETLQV